MSLIINYGSRNCAVSEENDNNWVVIEFLSTIVDVGREER